MMTALQKSRNIKLLSALLILSACVTGCATTATQQYGEYIGSADKYMESKDPAQALEQYRMANKVDPDLAAKNKIPDKIRYLDFLIQARGFEQRENALAAQNKYEDALAFSTEDPLNVQADIKRMEKKRYDAHYQAGLRYYQCGEMKPAIKEFESAKQILPSQEDPARMLQKAAAYSGTPKVCHVVRPCDSISSLAEYYYGTIRRYDTISFVLQCNTIPDPTNVMAGTQICFPPIELADGRWMNPETEPPPPFKCGDIAEPAPDLLSEAANFKNNNAYDDAIRLYQQILDKDQDNMVAIKGIFESHFLNALSYLTKKELEKAEQQIAASRPFKERCQGCGDMENARLDQLLTASEDEAGAGNCDRIAETIRFFRSMYPNFQKDRVESIVATCVKQDREARYARGVTSYDQGRFDQAIEEFEAVYNADSGYKDTKRYLYDACFQAGKAAMDAGNCEKATQAFKKSMAFTKKSDYLITHYERGERYFQKQKKEELVKAICEWKLVEAVAPQFKNITSKIKAAELLLQRL